MSRDSRRLSTVSIKNDMANIFGKVLRNARRSKSLPLSKVVTQIIKEDGTHISIQYLSDLEQGKRVSSQPYFIEQTAEILDIDVDWLYYLAGKFPMVEQEKRMSETDFKRSMRRFRDE